MSKFFKPFKRLAFLMSDGWNRASRKALLKESFDRIDEFEKYGKLRYVEEVKNLVSYLVDTHYRTILTFDSFFEASNPFVTSLAAAYLLENYLEGRKKSVASFARRVGSNYDRLREEVNHVKRRVELVDEKRLVNGIYPIVTVQKPLQKSLLEFIANTRQ